MRPVLVLRHVPHESLGLLADVFHQAGVTYNYVDMYDRPPQHLQLAHLAGLVILGGPMNVDESERYPFLAPEVHWIRDAIRLGLPVLGICLGSQLMAKALGANVYANARKEIGWYDIELTDEGVRDPLFAGTMPADGSRARRVFQWHGDTFDLPEDAVLLATSPLCHTQAFRYGERAYALQFHVEMTGDMLGQWMCEPGNCDELAALDYIHAEQITETAAEQLPRVNQLGRNILGEFARLCQQRAG